MLGVEGFILESQAGQPPLAGQDVSLRGGGDAPDVFSPPITCTELTTLTHHSEATGLPPS